MRLIFYLLWSWTSKLLHLILCYSYYVKKKKKRSEIWHPWLCEQISSTAWLPSFKSSSAGFTTRTLLDHDNDGYDHSPNYDPNDPAKVDLTLCLGSLSWYSWEIHFLKNALKINRFSFSVFDLNLHEIVSLMLYLFLGCFEGGRLLLVVAMPAWLCIGWHMVVVLFFLKKKKSSFFLISVSYYSCTVLNSLLFFFWEFNSKSLLFAETTN